MLLALMDISTASPILFQPLWKHHVEHYARRSRSPDVLFYLLLSISLRGAFVPHAQHQFASRSASPLLASK